VIEVRVIHSTGRQSRIHCHAVPRENESIVLQGGSFDSRLTTVTTLHKSDARI